MIIDRQPMTRLGIRRSLEGDWDYEELFDGRGAIELLNTVGRFDVAIVEMRASARGVPSGSATIRRLLDAEPGLAVIARGGRIERHAINEAFDAGAGAYVSTRSPSSTLRRAVDSVLATKPFVDPDADRDGTLAITPRQREILQAIADGYSAAQVAHRLGLSTQTVGTHAKLAVRRLDAKDRAHAVAIAMRDSLID